MYLMEGRKLQDSHLMDGREMLNLSLQTSLFRGFLRFLFLSTLFTHCSTNFCRRKDSQFDRQEKRYGGYEGKKQKKIVCYILDI